MALAVMLYMCVLHLILNDVHAESYPNSGTWGVGGGGRRVLMELLPFSFYVLQYLEMIFPSMGSRWSSLQDIWGIFWGWWRRWRTVTSALNMVAILDFISIGNSMICCDIWHKYHKWYFEFVIRNFTSVRRWNLRQFWNITSGIYAKYHVQIMLLTALKGFVIFTCRYFKLSWNTTALSQSNCRNFPCNSIKNEKSGKTVRINNFLCLTCT